MASEGQLPICVDLDGTLIQTDLLHESALSFLKQQPWRAPLLLLWLFQGKATLKRQLAQRGSVGVESLPYRLDLLDYLRAQRAAGRSLILATAADSKLANAVSAHLGIFDQVLSSDGTQNLSGAAKAQRLRELLGDRKFVYAGDSTADLPVWEASAEAVLVGGAAALHERVSRDTRVGRVFGSQRVPLWELLKALRTHQWVKNVLIFVPLLTAHKLEPASVREALLAFASMSLCASAIYIINDLTDLESDRRHPRKRMRPFASGAVSIRLGLLAAPALLAMSFGLALTRISASFSGLLLAYLVLTSLYSFRIKKSAILDVMLLAGLYTIRIFGGAVATSTPVSQWLLAFSMFLFLSLAMVKRYSEVLVMESASEKALHGRGYRAGDGQLLLSMGTACGYLSVLVLAFYVNHPDVTRLYASPERLWIICMAVFYWLSHIWLKASRGEMHDDPIVFAVRDRVSYGVGAVALMAMVWAT